MFEKVPLVFLNVITLVKLLVTFITGVQKLLYLLCLLRQIFPLRPFGIIWYTGYFGNVFSMPLLVNF